MRVPIFYGDFEQLISTSPQPVVIDFFASWCPKCAMMEPVFERAASALSKNAVFYKIDIDLSEASVQKLGIEIVPTFVVFYKGEIKGYTIGVLSENILRQRIFEMISS